MRLAAKMAGPEDLADRLLASIIRRLCRDPGLPGAMSEREALLALAQWLERYRKQRRVAGRRGGRPRKDWPADLGPKPSLPALDPG